VAELEKFERLSELCLVTLKISAQRKKRLLREIYLSDMFLDLDHIWSRHIWCVYLVETLCWKIKTKTKAP